MPRRIPGIVTNFPDQPPGSDCQVNVGTILSDNHPEGQKTSYEISAKVALKLLEVCITTPPLKLPVVFNTNLDSACGILIPSAGLVRARLGFDHADPTRRTGQHYFWIRHSDGRKLSMRPGDQQSLQRKYGPRLSSYIGVHGWLWPQPDGPNGTKHIPVRWLTASESADFYTAARR